ncbi:DUF2236 domain-containing protein [Phototrophicus methaneseepsis]|uniref:DUF2236 domain-containing protein n=2 Tax=Phototrophicus methaneseepsis TaxID=2710758 RepID=A0A7S8IEF7_9CHLR|nr:DUF2236 domain-containing protein [Phototrophicus methaneseepsis]
MGTRVLLMQIAHPMVAESVYNHSYVFKKPIKRLFRTLSLTLALVYGTQSETEIALKEIEEAHRPATGRLTEPIGKHMSGAAYNPRNPRQAFWVQATLVEGAVTGYETFVGPLSEADKQAFYVESQQIGVWMGINRQRMPATYNAMLDYMQEAVETGEVAVSEKARKIAPFITGQSWPGLSLLSHPLYRLSVGLLPGTIQQQFGFKPFSPFEQHTLNIIQAATYRFLPLMPGFLRYMTPYQRAMARLRAHAVD